MDYVTLLYMQGVCMENFQGVQLTFICKINSYVHMIVEGLA